VAASLFGGLLGYYAGGVFGSTAAQTTATFLGSVGFALAAGMIAPRHHAGVAMIIAAIVLLLAVTVFVLAHFTALEPYANMPDTLKALIPVAQILGGIYAVFWLQQLLARRLEVLLRKMRQLVWSVGALGLLLTVAGLVNALANHQWLGFEVGLGVLGLAFLTWMFQRINLLVSTSHALRHSAARKH
jgi:hypothetical protein